MRAEQWPAHMGATATRGSAQARCARASGEFASAGVGERRPLRALAAEKRSHPLPSDSTPRVESIAPAAAIPGGEIAIHGRGFAASNNARPRVIFGDVEANVLIAAETY